MWSDPLTLSMNIQGLLSLVLSNDNPDEDDEGDIQKKKDLARPKLSNYYAIYHHFPGVWWCVCKASSR